MNNTIFLKQARAALERAEASMSADALASLESRQLLADIRMLVRAIDPDYFQDPSESVLTPRGPLAGIDVKFPFDSEVA